MKAEPLGDRVIIRPLDEEDKTRSGIFIPSVAQKKPSRGIVLAVGPGEYRNGKLVSLEVKVSDEVLFSRYGGTEIKIEDQDVLVLRESDIFVKLIGGEND